MAQAEFSKKKTLFTEIYLNLRKKLAKRCIGMYGAEI
jgi:hypothetical protein